MNAFGNSSRKICATRRSCAGLAYECRNEIAIAARSDFASVTALTTGPVGERLVDFVAEVTSRYRPDAVALTELMFDNNTYGGDDRDSYLLASGGTDWPRLANGDIDVEHPSLGAWRSKSLANSSNNGIRPLPSPPDPLAQEIRRSPAS